MSMSQADLQDASSITESSQPFSNVTSLFGESMPTEAELKGEEASEEPTEEPTEATSEGTESESPSPSDEEQEGETQEAESDEQTEEKESQKPPAGYVPLQALHEERGRRQQQAEELKYLREEIERLKVAKPEPQEERKAAKIPEDLVEEVNDFAKSYPEYAEMIREGSKEGDRLRQRLSEYGPAVAFDLAENIAFRREVSSSREQEGKQREEMERRVTYEKCTGRIQQAIPEFYSEDGKVVQEIVNFANKQGIDQQTLAALSNPYTEMVVDGEKVVLGERAADFTIMLHNLMQSERGASPETISKKVEEEAKKKTAETVGKKFKEKTSDYRSLGDAARQPGDTKVEDMSPTQWHRLSDEEKMAWLGR